jgi:dephospho-CoA kinase
MLKIGLTGGIGSGKSTVSSILKEKGLPVIDADIISREIYVLYPGLTKIIKSEFGENFYDDQGNLKRRELGNYIFQKPIERQKLEDIVIPYIIKEIFIRLDEYYKKGENWCVVDAPTLIEHKLHERMDFNILVWVDKKTQTDRVKKRDGLTDKQVLERINAQMSLESKREVADFIIDNSSDFSTTRNQVERVVNTLKEYCK